MLKEEKVIGIVGGLGVEASAKLYIDIVSTLMIEKESLVYPAIALWNVPISKEDDLMMTREQKDDNNTLLNLLIDAISRLRKCGANVIGIACNTIHFVLHKLPLYEGFHLINIVDCTIERVLALNENRVGILATDCTLKSGLYENILKTHGIEVVSPNASDQEIVMKVIHEALDKIITQTNKEELIRIIKALNVNAVILGCTELPLIISESSIYSIKIIDSLDSLKLKLINTPAF